ncbi:hypothetical protein B0H19DRAFT_1075591 [Mycena capillaripes]|nr:hypothetical protein B0H19DRAFT_1075591 [Mycena capillaripes]
MDDILLNDDEEDTQLASNWDPSQWISNGKIYHDVPTVVEVARRHILKIPPSFAVNLPPKALSIAQLLEFDLPPIIHPTIHPMDDGTERFSDEAATEDIEAVLPLLVVPTRSEHRQLLKEFGQAWFDGKKSLRTWINPQITSPFWVLIYWAEVLDAIEAKHLWLDVASWLENRGKTEEEMALKRTIQSLWRTIGWHGRLRGFAGISVSELASFFSKDYLAGNLVDAMVDILSIRLKEVGGPRSNATVIVNTTFAQFIDLLRPREDGKLPISSHPAAQKYLKKYGTWLRIPDHTELHFVMYRPPNHWTACAIDFEGKCIRYGDGLKWGRPKDFFLALETWTADNFPGVEFMVTDDLPCATQTDGYNCPIISVNVIAHNVLGDPLWMHQTADAMRMKAFCDIAKHAFSVELPALPQIQSVDGTDYVENILAVNPDVNDTYMVDGSSIDITPGSTVVSAKLANVVSVRAKKRAADRDDEDDERKRKIAKTSKSEPDCNAVPHPFFTKGFKPTAPSKVKKTNAARTESSSVGISKSATAARKQRANIKSGTFQPSAKRTENFRGKCPKIDPGACFEENSKEVQCSNCKTWVKMQEAYGVTRFKLHVEAKECTPPPPKPLADLTKCTLENFSLVSTRPQPKNPPAASTIKRPCPGLTHAFDEAVGKYLDRAVSNGGGGHAVNYYSLEIFKKEFKDLTKQQKETVYTARAHDHTWRNDMVEIDPNSSTTPPCGSCRLLATTKAFKNAINREASDPKNLRFVPHINQNAHAGMLYAKFLGLKALISKDNEYSLERRYFQHVINGDFKNDKVFNGIIQAKVMAKDREIRGVGMQNFKYDSDMDAVFGLIHTISPRAYRELQKHFPMRTERSIKHIISTTPRFPIGIADETFIYATQYLQDYKYPLGAPLSLAVDDTKLFLALRPLYDGVNQRWFIVGTTGEHIVVPNADGLHQTLDELESSAELATKLRLWVLQIPIPDVPPLALAILPIGSKVKGPQLADWQIQLMEGLVSRGFRITSSGGDGASVERDCQRRTASASKLVETRIKHPDPEYPDIVIQLWDLNGNIWVVIQDAKHGRKTFRNNAFSGAHTMTLGNFLVFFEQIHTLGMKPKTPLYRRDFINSDRMDDPAAARFFSADFLEQAAEDPAANLGLVVYLLVFGDLIDAWQSRTLSQHERAKIVIRTHLFLQTWRMFLTKAGYPEARHFISKEAFDIAQILINGLLGLIIIHRDHLASVRVPKKKSDFKKQASGYCHTYYSSEAIDYDLLNKYPTDIELSAAYEMASQENECLWSLLGIYPARIQGAPPRGLAQAPSPDPAFEHLYLQEDDDSLEISEKSPAEELQSMIDSLKTTANLSRAADEQLDGCVMAAVALSMDELARVEDLPESNPESTPTAKPKTGNAANAELAANGRSKEYSMKAVKRRRTIFAKLKCISIVTESGVGPDDAHQLVDGCYGFAIIGSEIALVRGKAGTHSWTATCETIGALSFVVAQVYEHEFRRHFKKIHNADVHLGIMRFAHLPVGSFVALLPKDEAVKSQHNHVEIGVSAYKIFEELTDGKEKLSKAVASLNTVRRKGKANIHIMELPEDDCIDE